MLSNDVICYMLSHWLTTIDRIKKNGLSVRDVIHRFPRSVSKDRNRRRRPYYKRLITFITCLHHALQMPRCPADAFHVLYDIINSISNAICRACQWTKDLCKEWRSIWNSWWRFNYWSRHRFTDEISMTIACD